MNKEKWKWLFQPLSRTNRSRLELTLGVVVAAAATVGLSTVMRPDPAKLAARMIALHPPPSAERESEPLLAPADAPGPKVAPELVSAVASGEIARVEALYKPGMALDGLLGVAAEPGHVPMTQWLLDHGADVHEDEAVMNAPILLGDEHPDVVALLLARGAHEPSVATAAQAGARNAVRRLLAAHAPLDETNPSPVTAAVSSTRATPENKRLVLAALLDAGASPNADEHDTALGAAVRSCDVPPEEGPSDCPAIIDLLVKHKARVKGDALLAVLTLEPSLRDRTLDLVLAAPVEPGATATALAEASYADPATLRRILAKGVDWRWHDGEDDAALPVVSAVQRGDRDYLRDLLAAGAPADASYKDGSSALGEAIGGSASGGPAFARCVEELIAHGADVNRRLPDGRTPLFAAAEAGDLRVITALLDHGARVNELVLDDTALDAAEQNGHTPAARLIHSRGGRRARASHLDTP